MAGAVGEEEAGADSQSQRGVERKQKEAHRAVTGGLFDAGPHTLLLLTCWAGARPTCYSSSQRFLTFLFLFW